MVFNSRAGRVTTTFVTTVNDDEKERIAFSLGISSGDGEIFWKYDMSYVGKIYRVVVTGIEFEVIDFFLSSSRVEYHCLQILK